MDPSMQQPSSTNSNLEHISQALAATLDPRVSNHIRQQALQHLEAVKSQPDAPSSGFALASSRDQNNAVRYYGLQLLEFGVKYRWTEYSDEQQVQLREWVRTLAAGLEPRDALFLRNKTGQVWVEVSKRCWGGDDGDWANMDEDLLKFWEGPAPDNERAVNKLFVLYILEMLSEDIMNSEDTVAGLRLEVLGPALNEITISQNVYKEHLATRGTSQEVRSGAQGWLNRICELFSNSIKQMRSGGYQELVQAMELCAVKSLNTMKSVMSWITFQAVEEVNLVDCLFLPFHTSNVPLQTAAVEVLLALACRHSTLQHTWMGLVRQMLQADRIAVLKQAFEQAKVEPGEDDDKYTMQKKMAELISVLADAIAQYHAIVDHSVDLPTFYNLLLVALQHQSLTVSIPALHSWTKQLAVQQTDIMDLVLTALPSLLQTCSARLVRYEAIPADSQDPTLDFLNEDFDTIPERHAFLGNYRRYCNTIIQSIARSKPIDALSYVLSETQSMLQDGPYTTSRGFSPAAYSKTSFAVLKFDAQYNVVGSALKGYSAWTQDVASLSPSDPIHGKAEQDRNHASGALQEWCKGVVAISLDDPGVAEQVMSIIAQILKILRPVPASFALDVVQHFLMLHVKDEPQHSVYHESVIAFEHTRVIELQKLALNFSNELLAVYGDLEPRILEMTQAHSDDARLVWGYRSFLLMIIHRASGIDTNSRISRLEDMLKPVYEAWSSPALASSLTNLESFNAALGLDDLPQFCKEKQFDRIQDWSSQNLDEAGRQKQEEIKNRSDRLPLRMTKSLLAASCERLKPGSDEYETAIRLWSSLIPVILPKLLPMLRHAAAFSNMDNWSHCPAEIRAVIQRTLQDRFWQSGISNESKDEFYARISGSRTSFEGFASTVRGAVRNVREHSYHVLYFLTKFEEPFYGLPDLSDPLADALFENVGSLGANHLSPIINLATGLVQRCPPHHRMKFLPPLLRKMFVAMDEKIGREWSTVAQTQEKQENIENDDLGDEMRTESVLRQLTYSMVAFVPFLLEFDKVPATGPTAQPSSEATNGGANGQHAQAPAKPTVSDLVLSDPSILEPLLMFCTHALRMRDTRCCQTMCRVFRSIIPHFSGAATSSLITPEVANQVGDYVCTEVLKACITSLHEPYFVDMQKDLAGLITQIIALYSPRSPRPREVLASLPEMNPAHVDSVIQTLVHGKNGARPSERSQRSLVMQLLENVRGVSIHEAAKIDRKKEIAAAAKKKSVGQQYMELEQKPVIVEGDEAGLDGVAGLFGDA